MIPLRVDILRTRFAPAATLKLRTTACVLLMPLSLVVLVSMIKDAFEDSKRHKSDNMENNNKTM